MTTHLRTIPFNKTYYLKDFDCGDNHLNQYLINYASQDIKRYLASVYICENSLDINNNEKKVLGYYTLSSNSINIAELNNELTKKLPYYPYLPTILIGRLAVDKNFHGQRIGEYLLMDALNKAFESEVAAFAVIVEAKNTSAINFYKKYDFIQFMDNPNNLFLPMKIIAKLFITHDN